MPRAEEDEGAPGEGAALEPDFRASRSAKVKAAPTRRLSVASGHSGSGPGQSGVHGPARSDASSCFPLGFSSSRLMFGIDRFSYEASQRWRAHAEAYVPNVRRYDGSSTPPSCGT